MPARELVIQLPRSQPSVPARDGRDAGRRSASAAAGVPRLDGVRVLIVDDDRESCEMMLEALGDYGASLRAALSAGAAIDALSEFTPDLVLTDIAMPARDGYAVHERGPCARNHTRAPRAGRGGDANAHAEDRERAIAAGFDEYWRSQSSPRPSHVRSPHLPPCATGDEPLGHWPGIGRNTRSQSHFHRTFDDLLRGLFPLSDVRSRVERAETGPGR